MSQIKQKKAQMSVVCTKSCCGKQWCASVCNDMMRVCVCKSLEPLISLYFVSKEADVL